MASALRRSIQERKVGHTRSGATLLGLFGASPSLKRASTLRKPEFANGIVGGLWRHRRTDAWHVHTRSEDGKASIAALSRISLDGLDRRHGHVVASSRRKRKENVMNSVYTRRTTRAIHTSDTNFGEDKVTAGPFSSLDCPSFFTKRPTFTCDFINKQSRANFLENVSATFLCMFPAPML